MALRNLETSLNRLHESRYLVVHKADNEISGPFAYLKHRIEDIVKITFFNIVDAENDFTLHLYTLKHRFIDFTQEVYFTLRRQIMSSQGDTPTYNIT
jgi:hypothetical protein